jgi:hypothetical protein
MVIGNTLLSKEEIIFKGSVEPFENSHAIGLLDGTAMLRAQGFASCLKVVRGKV